MWSRLIASSHPSRLMNVCHQTPLTDDEVGVLFRWLDPKGLGAVSREDLQARLDGFLKQEEVRPPTADYQLVHANYSQDNHPISRPFS